MKPFSDPSIITKDEAEEFGIDWSERDGFSIRRMRVSLLWGPDSERKLFKRGVRQQSKLAEISKSLIGGRLTDKKIALATHTGMSTIQRIRLGLIAEGFEVKKQSRRNVLLDLRGQKFGRLTVMAQCKNSIGKDGGSVWECVCKCGTKTSAQSRNLRRGYTKSCGCLNTERRKNLGLSGIGGRTRWKNNPGLGSAARAARGRRNLTDGYVRELLRTLPHGRRTAFTVPGEFIEAKREYLKVVRLLKEMRK